MEPTEAEVRSWLDALASYVLARSAHFTNKRNEVPVNGFALNLWRDIMERKPIRVKTTPGRAVLVWIEDRFDPIVFQPRNAFCDECVVAYDDTYLWREKFAPL